MSQGTTLTNRPPKEAGTTTKDGSVSPSGGKALQKYLDDHVSRMQSDIDATTRKMELERRNLHEARENLRRSKEEYEEMRQKYGAPKGAGGEELKRVQNKLAEGKLAQQTQNLNNQNDDNNRQRKEINRQRQETSNLNGVSQRIAADSAAVTEQIVQKKAELDDLTELNNAAQEELRQLMSQQRQEREQMRKEVEFLKQESLKADRRQKEQEILTARDMAAPGESPSKRLEYKVSEEEVAFDEPRIRSKVLRVALQNVIATSAIASLETRTQMLEDAMATIRVATGIHEADDMVRALLEFEKRNYSSITYHAELQKELAALTSKVRELQGTVLDHQSAQDGDEQRRREALVALEVQIKETHRALELKEKELWYAEGVLKDAAPVLKDVCVQLEAKWVDGSVAPASHLTRTQAFQQVVAEEVGQAARASQSLSAGHGVEGVREEQGEATFDEKDESASQRQHAVEGEDEEPKVSKEMTFEEYEAQRAAREEAAAFSAPPTPSRSGRLGNTLSHSPLLQTSTSGRPPRSVLAPGPSQIDGLDKLGASPSSAGLEVYPLLRFLERYVAAHKAHVADLAEVAGGSPSRPSSATMPSSPPGKGVAAATAEFRARFLQEKQPYVQTVMSLKQQAAAEASTVGVATGAKTGVAAYSDSKLYPKGVPTLPNGQVMPGPRDPSILPAVPGLLSEVPVAEEAPGFTRKELREQTLAYLIERNKVDADLAKDSLRARTIRKAEQAQQAEGYEAPVRKPRGAAAREAFRREEERRREERLLEEYDLMFDEGKEDFFGGPQVDSRPATANSAAPAAESATGASPRYQGIAVGEYHPAAPKVEGQPPRPESASAQRTPREEVAELPDAPDSDSEGEQEQEEAVVSSERKSEEKQPSVTRSEKVATEEHVAPTPRSVVAASEQPSAAPKVTKEATSEHNEEEHNHHEQQAEEVREASEAHVQGEAEEKIEFHFEEEAQEEEEGTASVEASPRPTEDN